MLKRNNTFLFTVAVSFCFIYFYVYKRFSSVNHTVTEEWLDNLRNHPSSAQHGNFTWANRAQRFPVQSFIPFPTGKAIPIPSIQHDFAAEARSPQTERQAAVKSTFMRAWNGYRKHAWMADELAPVSGGSRNHFGGWGATLVDTLDTLWIMGLETEFEEAVESIASIDFSDTDEEEINIFETTIRYMGGFLAAYDLSDGKHPVLLRKALELGEMLYAAFDTPNRMPVTRWRWKESMGSIAQQAHSGTLVAEIGSLSLEFTRLTQLSGDPRFFDAIQRISNVFERQQPRTNLPGLWPVVVDAENADFSTDSGFSLGAMADSAYEYLPKQYMLLDGLSQQYRFMYEKAIAVAEKYIFFRPMTPDNADILISGNVRAEDGQITLDPQGEHLACYTGGMLAIGSKVFDRPDDLDIARKLVHGCIWAYRHMPAGIMPETFHVLPCDESDDCDWDEQKWLSGAVSRDPEAFQDMSAEQIKLRVGEMKLIPGFTDIPDRRYILRPEAIESMFILYRITGVTKLQDIAWEMFQAIETSTKTEFGNAALSDITESPPTKTDSMESFWTAETLKYFYLIFSEPSLVSLDEWVFNTEAHPFKRPTQ